MSFTTVNNVTQITGVNATYSGKVKNADVNYGRNAMFSYYEYLHELAFGEAGQFPGTGPAKNESEKPSINFSLKYMPDEKVTPETINKMALLGAAFADLGNKLSVSVEQINRKVQSAFGEKASAAAFDINGDGQIDVAENAVAILIKDMGDATPTKEAAEKKSINLGAENIDGVITNTGENNFTAFLSLQNVDSNKQTVSQIYQAFKLDEAKNIFASDPNNYS